MTTLNDKLIEFATHVGEDVKNIETRVTALENAPASTGSGGAQADWNATTGDAEILNKPTLAAVATSGAYADLTGKPTIPTFPALATVATSGAYSDLTGKPSIPAAQVQSDWNATSGAAEILNKPTIPTVPSLATVATSGAYADLTGKPVIPTLPSLATVATSGAFADLTGKPTIPAAYVPPTGVVDLGDVTGDVTLDLSVAHGFKLNLTGNVSLSIINAPAAALIQRVAIVLRSNEYSITWDTNIVPFNLVPPTLSLVGKDFFELTTFEGTTWMGNQVASGFASTVLVEDDFLGSAGPIDGHVTNIGNKAWVSSPPGVFTLDGAGSVVASVKSSGSSSLIDLGVSDYSMKITASSQSDDNSNCCLADVLFRTIDPANTWGLEIDSRFQHVTIHTVNNGSYNDLCVVSYAGAVSNGPVEIQLDLKGPVVTLSIAGVEVASMVNTYNKLVTKAGIFIAVGGNPSGSAKFTGPIQVTPYKGANLNWPLFSKLADIPLIPLTPQGTYGDTDINDPNVFYDTPNNRWALVASCYSNKAGAGTSAGAQFSGADSQVQHVGMFYAPNIYGPYTADPANPVMLASPAEGSSAFNGGMVYMNGVYYHAYGSGSGTTISLATSTDLHTWVRKGVIVDNTKPVPVPSWRSQGQFDAFLRVRQDGTTLELWICGTDGGVKRFGSFSSVDQGVTWVENTAIAPVLPPPNVFLNGSAGEPAIYVPTGKEGQHYMLTFDYVQVPGDNSNPPVNRRVGMGISVDGGQTWHWRTNASQPGTFGFESVQNFDSFVIQGPDGKLYMFNSGSNLSGPSLDLNIQIEAQSAPWGFTSLIAS